MWDWRHLVIEAQTARKSIRDGREIPTERKKWVFNAALAEHGEEAEERQEPLGGGSY